MNRLFFLLLVSCGGVSEDWASRDLKVTGIDKDQNVAVGSTLNIGIQVSDSRYDMPNEPQVTLYIICNGKEVHKESQRPSANSAKFNDIEVTNKFRGQCVASINYQYGFESMNYLIDFTVGEGGSSNQQPCIDLEDLKIYLGKQVDICNNNDNNSSVNLNYRSLQCGDSAIDVDLPNDNGDTSLVVVAKDSIPSNCKITIDDKKSFSITKPPTSGDEKNLAKGLMHSAIKEDERIKINLRAELDDDSGLFISVDKSVPVGGPVSHDWHKITSDGLATLTDFSANGVDSVWVLIYKKTDKGIWWDYSQHDL